MTLFPQIAFSLTFLVVLTAAPNCPAQNGATAAPAYAFARNGTTTTALDRYIAEPDESYEWKVAARRHRGGCREVVVDLTSLTWRSPDQVDRTRWQHWMTIVVPDGATATTAMLFITGGSNRDGAPNGADELIREVAIATQSAVIELRTVPNQPLSLEGEARQRYEDDLLAASWNRYLETDDPTWIAQLPMAKSAVTAMTAAQEVLAAEAAADADQQWPQVEKFVVAGASKRGWTSWLTAATDRRVVAVAPIVIDMLNITPSMRHHRACYGAWSKALADYEKQKIVDRLGDESTEELIAIVDPYVYRDRLTMPKCIINAAQDEFFLPDSSRFYFQDLVGEKHLSYTPNTGHGLDGSDALDTLVAFHASIVHDLKRPTISWTGDHSAGEHQVTATAKPIEAVLYRAVNRTARDFRLPVTGRAFRATPLEPADDGSYKVRVEPADEGYSATFARFAFDIGAATPFRVSTPVWVAPDVEPFAE